MRKFQICSFVFKITFQYRKDVETRRRYSSEYITAFASQDRPNYFSVVVTLFCT